MVLGPFPERKGPRPPGRTPATIANIKICEFVKLRINQSLSPDLFFEGFEERNDEDDDDKDEGKGG